MFGRKKKQQKKEEHRQAVRKGLLFWLPGGSSRIDVYLDYCVVRCLGKTKLPENRRVIPFTDVKENDWFYEAVRFAYENDLFNGTSETAFNPNASMTRAMLVQVLYRMQGSPEAGGSTFTDVADSAWYAKAVAWASDKGIVAGYSETQFGPEDTITREQLAVILNRYATYKGYNTSKTADLAAFQDADQISEWARVPVQWANVMKLLNGRTSTTLAPKGSATRAEVAKILVTFQDTVKR